jgi:hypothetical protein
VVMRPIDFCVVFWGREFREYFLEFCLASLLSPNNIPVVENRTDSRFLICTSREDWDCMQNHPLYRVLAQTIQPVWLELPPDSAGETKIQRMSMGHKLIAELMHARKAYGSFIYPDTIFADGIVAEAQHLARSGKKVVLANCPRFANERLLTELTAQGVKRRGEPIVLQADELIALALSHIHSETLRYEWNAPYFYSRSPVAVWWRLPGRAVLMYSTCWAPILVDYAVLATHDTTTLTEWTIDGNYIYRNFPNRDDVHASTTMTLISFTPESRLSYLPLKRLRTDYVSDVSRWFKEMNLRSFMFSKAMDPLKRELFATPLHLGAVVDEAGAKQVERQASATMTRCFLPVEPRTQTVLDLLWILNDGLLKNFGLWLKHRLRKIKCALTSFQISRFDAPA